MSHARRFAALATAATAAIAAAPATAAAYAGHGHATTLRLTTGNIVVTPTDLGAPGKTPGDTYAYIGDVFQDGKTVGKVYGTHTSLGVVGDREILQGLITFRIGRSEIMAGGMAAYPADSQSGTVIDEPFKRPIIGGTGRYDGARGTLTTVRNPDGTYSQRFRLLR
ncbi:MAG TPA: hypothetical protein VFR97_01515 [Capillimicrobium sp.]|nr:hypothetical protein [Capillimicrobium sp.]